jgi:hypothetical protein
MADVAAASTTPVDKTTKPPKPDEDVFKKNVDAAEKAHKAVMAKLVCSTHFLLPARQSAPVYKHLA